VPTPTDPPSTHTVGVVTPHDIVAVGLRTMLADTKPSIRLVDAEHEEPDVLLYDVYALLGDDTTELDRWLKETPSTVVALTRPLRPDLGALALERGAKAAVGLSASAEEILSVVHSACAGTLDDSPVTIAAEHETRLGDLAGLSPRETDVLRLVTLGRSNHEIAEELVLSVNSIKTYIRSAYRKIGVSHRAQAVVWALQHGFAPPAR
jgi:DNA-binding NarL/FixJ family response regulator